MKIYPLVTATKMVAVIVLSGSGLIYSALAVSQATVRDSSPVVSNPSNRSVLNSRSVSNGAAALGVTSSAVNTAGNVDRSFTGTPEALSAPNTAHQIQQLQQEISELRGLVEEQAFQLKRLKQQRLDDYLDLDRRLVELSQSKASGSNSASIPSNTTTAQSLTASSSNGSANTTVSGLAGSLPATSVNDAEEGKTLYRKAIDQLLNKQDYRGAQDNFTQYLNTYPRGEYVPNVYYWQGQIYLTDSKKTEAEKVFSKLVGQYKDHQKTPDAKYKLATIYFDQGKKTEAKTLLNEVAASDTDASRLAKSFLANQY